MTAYTAPLLTQADLAELTGLELPGAQKRWLDRHRIAYCLRADGHPRTTWGAVEAAMGLVAADQPDYRALG